MTSALRLTKEETKAVDQLRIDINKSLIKHNKEPLKNSEILHIVLSISLKDENIKRSILKFYECF